MSTEVFKDTGPGESVGRYRLARLMVTTPFGPEYLAMQKTGGGFLSACRVLVVDPALSSDHAETLARMRSLLALNHSAIVRMLDAGSVDGQLYVAYEHHLGRDLERVREAHETALGLMSPALATHIAAEAARGLAYALRHGRGETSLTHGRLEPPFVFLAEDGQVRLMYFGLASALRRSPATDGAGSRRDAQALVDMLRLLAVAEGSPTAVLDERQVTATERFEVMVARAEGRWRSSSRKDAVMLLPELELVQRKIGENVGANDVVFLLTKLFDAELRQESDELASLLHVGVAGPGRPGREQLTPPPAEVVDGAWRPAPGHTLAGRYRIERTIGEGGMGEVFEAEHLELGRRVAIKVLRSYLSRDPEFAERFRREARAACRIGHRNIVDITDFGTTPDGRLFYVMALLEGMSLEGLLGAEGALLQGRAIRIVLQLCDALDAAHEAGVVHRDLKPDNIMLTREGVETEIVRVVDFGIAQDDDPRAKRVTLTGQVVGTPGYMAPEQVRGIPTDPRTDIYSTGVILYEMITGMLPFRADSAVEVMGAHVKERPVPPREATPERDIHPLLERVAMKALEKAPEDRFQTMAEMAFELWEALEAIQQGPIVRRASQITRVPTASALRPLAELPEDDQEEPTLFTGLPAAFLASEEARAAAAAAAAATPAAPATPVAEDVDIEVDLDLGSEPAGLPPEVAPAPPPRGYSVSDLDIDALIKSRTSPGPTIEGSGNPFALGQLPGGIDGPHEGDRTVPYRGERTPDGPESWRAVRSTPVLSAREEAAPAAAAPSAGQAGTGARPPGPPPVPGAAPRGEVGGPRGAATPEVPRSAPAFAPVPAPSAPEHGAPAAPARAGSGRGLVRALVVVLVLVVLATLAAGTLALARHFGSDDVVRAGDEPTGGSEPDPAAADAQPAERRVGAVGLELLRGEPAGPSPAPVGDGGSGPSPPSGGPEPDSRRDKALAAARDEVRRGRYGKAFVAYRGLEKAYPTDFEIVSEYGELQVKRNKNGPAADLLARAVELRPDEVETRLALVRALARLGKRRDAREHCRAVLEIDPQNRSAHRLARALR